VVVHTGGGDGRVIFVFSEFLGRFWDIASKSKSSFFGGKRLYFCPCLGVLGFILGLLFSSLSLSLWYSGWFCIQKKQKFGIQEKVLMGRAVVTSAESSFRLPRCISLSLSFSASGQKQRNTSSVERKGEGKRIP